jgi:hypothetical protein
VFADEQPRERVDLLLSGPYPPNRRPMANTAQSRPTSLRRGREVTSPGSAPNVGTKDSSYIQHHDLDSVTSGCSANHRWCLYGQLEVHPPPSSRSESGVLCPVPPVFRRNSSSSCWPGSRSANRLPVVRREAARTVPVHQPTCMRVCRTRLTDALYPRFSATRARQAKFGLGATTSPLRFIRPSRSGSRTTKRNPQRRDCR